MERPGGALFYSLNTLYAETCFLPFLSPTSESEFWSTVASKRHFSSCSASFYTSLYLVFAGNVDLNFKTVLSMVQCLILAAVNALIEPRFFI